VLVISVALLNGLTGLDGHLHLLAIHNSIPFKQVGVAYGPDFEELGLWLVFGIFMRSVVFNQFDYNP